MNTTNDEDKRLGSREVFEGGLDVKTLVFVSPWPNFLTGETP
jgi:hypothetical protein